MKQYENIIFLQGDNANEAMELLEQGTTVLFKYLLQWYYSGEHEILKCNDLKGSSDRYKIFKDGYILTWNSRLGYCGLIREVIL